MGIQRIRDSLALILHTTVNRDLGVDVVAGKRAVCLSNVPADAVAAAHSVDSGRWRRWFSQVIDRIAPRFARYAPLRHAASLVRGLLSGLEKKNCWTIAEHTVRASPDGLQHLLSQGQVGRRRGPGRAA